MSMAVCKVSVPPAGLGLEGGGVRCGERGLCPSPAAMSPQTWLVQQQEDVAKEEEVVVEKESQFDIWSSIQSQKAAAPATELPPPYVHPLMRRSSSLSQKSLEICTESLGSETGSDGFSLENMEEYYSSKVADEMEEVSETEEGGDKEVTGEMNGGGHAFRHPERKELAAVNYHCSISRRSPPRVFPPPLPSISRRDGPCLHMRPHRRDGRLVVEAVPVPSQNYLHAQRHGGRLLLTFIDTTFEEIYPVTEDSISNLEAAESGVDDRGLSVNVAIDDDDDEEEEEDENLAGDEIDEMGEEEVEVVDRGIVVEVKVSRQPQLQSGAGKKVHRSSLVINKFVGGTPLAEKMADEEAPRRLELNTGSICSITTTTTAAVAVAAASSSSSAEPYWGTGKSPQHGQQNSTTTDKLHFTSKKLMNKQALLHQVRRCSQSHRPLFFWEPCCIATT